MIPKIRYSGHIRANYELKGFEFIDVGSDSSKDSDEQAAIGLFDFNYKELSEVKAAMQKLKNDGWDVHTFELRHDVKWMIIRLNALGEWTVDDSEDEAFYQNGEELAAKLNDENFLK